MLKNLLSNAFKFTEQGGVRLACRAADGRLERRTIRCCSRAPSVVAFEVTDTGIGIPPEKQRIIFEAFQQADASTSRKYGGTGLGLAISRELASLLGGEIQLRSTPGVGSTFTLYLPLTLCRPGSAQPRRAGGRAALAAGARDRARVRAARSSRSSRSPTTASQSGRATRVLLIVEDDPHYARVLGDLSRDKGFKVLVAANGAEALALAHEFQPDGRLARRLLA